MSLQLQHIYIIKGELVLETGLHIGAGKDSIQIGGIDSPVVRNPLTNQPYIPGSSIKGRLRSALEWRYGLATQNGGKPVGLELEDKPYAETIIRLFGVAGNKAHAEKMMRIGPTRLGVWDANLTEESAKVLQPINYREEKTENAINRITGVAQNPRSIERVPAGARFGFCMTLRKLEDADDRLLDELSVGLRLLELEGLGGSVSRGYGRIRFESLICDGQPFELPENPFGE